MTEPRTIAAIIAHALHAGETLDLVTRDEGERARRWLVAALERMREPAAPESQAGTPAAEPTDDEPDREHAPPALDPPSADLHPDGGPPAADPHDDHADSMRDPASSAAHVLEMMANLDLANACHDRKCFDQKLRTRDWPGAVTALGDFAAEVDAAGVAALELADLLAGMDDESDESPF